jgi:hypothetical protein
MTNEYFEQKKKIETLEDAKGALLELQELGRSVFLFAWEKGFHRELALFSMGLRDASFAEKDGETYNVES